MFLTITITSVHDLDFPPGKNPGLYLSVEDECCVEDGAPYPLQNVGAGRLRGFSKCPVFVEDDPDDFP